MYDLIFDLVGGIIIGVLGNTLLKRVPKERSAMYFLKKN